MGKRIGSATSSVEYSPAKARKRAKARRAEEARWASLAGPVEVRQVGGNREAWSPDGGALPPSGEQAASNPPR
jgi:hypothetical protein